MRNMNMPPQMDTLRLRRNKRILPIAAAAALMLSAACSSSEAPDTDAAPPSDSPASVPPAATPAAPSAAATYGGQLVMFRFDALDDPDIPGEAQPIIQVYAGPGESTADRMLNGTYRHGDEAPVACVDDEDTRTVTSNPGAGELEARSATWVQLAVTGDNGGPSYATDVYGFIVPEGAFVRDC